MLDYDTLSMEQLVAELGDLVVVDKVMSVKDHVEELKKAFLSKYYHFIDEKRDEFHAENPDTTEEFHYHFPLRVKFDQLYSQYRDKKNAHFKSLQNSLQANLETRLAIVEELKNLVHSQDSIPVTLKNSTISATAGKWPVRYRKTNTITFGTITTFTWRISTIRVRIVTGKQIGRAHV